MDTRDDYYNPRRGAKHSLFIQNAGGILGADNYFVKVTGETSWFFPLPLNTILNLRAKAGMIKPYGGKTTYPSMKSSLWEASTPSEVLNTEWRGLVDKNR